MDIELHELISWGVTTVVTLSSIFFWRNRVKKRSSDYMIIQGLMRGINEYSRFYAHIKGEIDKGRLEPSKENMSLLLDYAFTTNNAIMQSVLGVIKSLDVKKDVPIDAFKFLNSPVSQVNKPQNENVDFP